jgi:metal-responsive CopG/Arc/MetJ family transcriptional regulator
LARLNITLPDRLLDELSHISNKSKFIAEVLEKELKEKKQREVDRLLIEGYQKTRKEDAVLDADWEQATLENWSAS